MTTDTYWSWTILMRDGKSWHLDESVSILKLLDVFFSSGHEETDIEAIIRH